MKKILLKKERHRQKPVCNHEIIMDYIDLTPDKSQLVYYCKKCYEDFNPDLILRVRHVISSTSN
jgi:hypothetical protein